MSLGCLTGLSVFDGQRIAQLRSTVYQLEREAAYLQVVLELVLPDSHLLHGLQDARAARA